MIVSLEGSGPLFQQVYEALRGEILTGRLGPGARLPSSRSLASDLGVSRTTVMLAYDQLLAEGYVAGRVGSGTYVATELPDEAIDAPAPARPEGASPATVRLSTYGARVRALDVIAPTRPGAVRYDFRYGLPPVEEFPHETWRRILARRARSASLAALRYGPPEGYGPLREAIAGYLRRSRAVACRPEQVIVVGGSQQALDLTARVLVDPGDTVVLEEPHYQGARKVFQAAGARLVPVAVDGDGLDASALPAEAAGARLAYVTPSHQFPTGATMTLARRLELLRWAEAAGAYVLEDDYDSEFRYEGRPVESVQGLDRAGRCIYAGTFSKVMYPALRVGYMVLPEPLVEVFVKAKWLADRHTPTLEQQALADFIAEGHFERHLRRSRTRNAARRRVLLESLAEHLGDAVEVRGANAGIHMLAWLRGMEPADADALADRAWAAGVGVYPVAPSYYLTRPGRAGLVMGYASLNERDIRAGVRALAAVV
jgi:GntR family transcriptional regulator/MocR family aminotransferase